MLDVGVFVFEKNKNSFYYVLKCHIFDTQLYSIMCVSKIKLSVWERYGVFF